MKLCILGSTGKTGHEILRAALNDGHEVTVLVRSQGALHDFRNEARIIEGDALSAESVTDVISDQDAVLSALGVPFRILNGLAPIAFYSRSAANIVRVMESKGVRRFIGITMSDKKPESDRGFNEDSIFEYLLQNYIDDMRRMELLLERSSLDWTVIRAADFIETINPGTYRIWSDGCTPENAKISRTSLALFMLKCLGDDSKIGARVGIAH